MDLEKYKALLTAIDEGSLSAAAKKLPFSSFGKREFLRIYAAALGLVLMVAA